MKKYFEESERLGWKLVTCRSTTELPPASAPTFVQCLVESLSLFFSFLFSLLSARRGDRREQGGELFPFSFLGPPPPSPSSPMRVCVKEKDSLVKSTLKVNLKKPSFVLLLLLLLLLTMRGAVRLSNKPKSRTPSLLFLPSNSCSY